MKLKGKVHEYGNILGAAVYTPTKDDARQLLIDKLCIYTKFHRNFLNEQSWSDLLLMRKTVIKNCPSIELYI